MTDLYVLDVTDLIAREGWDCAACGHRHSGRTLGYICVGCPCPAQPPAAPPASHGDLQPIVTCAACDAGMRLAPNGRHYDDARGGGMWGVCATLRYTLICPLCQHDAVVTLDAAGRFAFTCGPAHVRGTVHLTPDDARAAPEDA